MLAAAPLSASGQNRSDDSLYRAADAAFDRGDMDEAIRLYQEVIKQQPDSVAARANLGVALAHAGRYPDAIVQYNQALKLAPDNASLLLDLALAWYKQAFFDKAAVELEKLRKMHPENKQSLYLLADCYLRLGRDRDTVALLQPIYDADSHDRAVNYALGMALIRSGQAKKGAALIAEVGQTASPNEVALLTAASQLAARDSKAAVETLGNALKSGPALPGAWTLYGRALMDNGDRAGARAAFLRALKADSNDFEANLYLGGMLRYDGKIAEATPYLEKAMVLRPASLEALFQIGLLNQANGRLEARPDGFAAGGASVSRFQGGPRAACRALCPPAPRQRQRAGAGAGGPTGRKGARAGSAPIPAIGDYFGSVTGRIRSASTFFSTCTIPEGQRISISSTVVAAPSPK